MSEEPLSKLTEAVNKATSHTRSSDPTVLIEQSLRIASRLTIIVATIIAWLREKGIIRRVDVTDSEPTQTQLPDFSPATVSEPPQVSSPDALSVIASEPPQTYSPDATPAVVLEPPQTSPIDKVAATRRRPEPDQIGEAEEKTHIEFSHFIENKYNYLNKQRQHRLDQAHLAFRVALISLILGIGLIFIGVICIFFANLSVGIVTGASSIIPNVITILAFRLNKEENDRLDVVAKELGVTEKTREAMNYISRIEDRETRDKAIIELAERLSP